MKSLFQLVCHLRVAAVGVIFSTAASATVFTFATDPFAGSAALTTPGRQVVAGEPSISFSIATDVFALDPGVFGIGNIINFASGLAGTLPTRIQYCYKGIVSVLGKTAGSNEQDENRYLYR